jgi:signal transduction histidine kinase
MERAIVNLVNNAIDASNKGQDISISIRTDKDRLIMVIRDYGVGMDQETLENIFIPFYTRKASGTGLGMSIAKKITIKSKPRSGTEVMIDLPRTV